MSDNKYCITTRDSVVRMTHAEAVAYLTKQGYRFEMRGPGLIGKWRILDASGAPDIAKISLLG